MLIRGEPNCDKELKNNLPKSRQSGCTINSNQTELSESYKNISDAVKASKRLIEKYKDYHHGQRCVIIGNGPSLNKMDLKWLKTEITFGLNKIFLLFEKWDFIPTYYVSVNPLVIEQNAIEMQNIPSVKFISLNGLTHIKNPQNIIFLKSINNPHFSQDPGNGIWEGYTVTYVAMQLAYFMGFNEVLLIGVDHFFNTPGAPNEEVVSEGEDPNHFHPNYFGKGTRWNLPDLKNSELAYSFAKLAFENDGRRIVDATLNGKLQVFPKIDYQELVRKFKDIDKLGEKNESEITHLIKQGEELFREGQFQPAQYEFDKVLRINPKNATACNDLGVMYYHQGDKNRAFEYYKKAVSLQPENITYLKNLADFYYVELGMVEDSIKIYSYILKANPNDVKTLLILGHISVALENFDDAILFYQRAFKIEPLNEYARQSLNRLRGNICG